MIRLQLNAWNESSRGDQPGMVARRDDHAADFGARIHPVAHVAECLRQAGGRGLDGLQLDDDLPLGAVFGKNVDAWPGKGYDF